MRRATTRKTPYRTGVPAALGFVLALIAIPTATIAQSTKRVNATNMSCKELRQLIKKEGAVIVTSKSPFSNGLVSERYVAGPEVCLPGQRIDYRRFVIVSNTNRCPVRFCTDTGFERGNTR